MKKQARNPMLEAVRGIACILVVFVHFRLQNGLQQPLITVARFAVPFFLILSGYFSCKESVAENGSYLKKQLKAAARLTLAGVIVSSAANIAAGLLDGSGAFKWLVDAFNMRTIMAFFLLNWAKTFSSVMYYLFMLLYVYGIFLLLNKKALLDRVYFLIPVLLTANILISHLMREPDYWMYSGNFLLTGLPFMLLGRFFRYRRVTVKNNALLIFGIITGIILSLVEDSLFGECYCYVGTVMLSAGVFLLCVNNPQLPVPGWLSAFGTNNSTLLFLLHCPVGYVIVAMAGRFGIDSGSWTGVIVIVVTMIISQCFIAVTQKIRARKAAA